MSKLSDIPVVVHSGQKYRNSLGVVAIKDGIKTDTQSSPRVAKPEWLRVVNTTTPEYMAVKARVKEYRLATVCEEAKCPNIAECWSHGTATIMLMGAVCTRACRFCSVDTGNPHGWLDKDEPEHTATTVSLMNLEYVVLTSVNRDDLPDGGAQHYADTVRAIKARCPGIKVEALTPDFQGVKNDVAVLLDSGVDVFAQNVETVQRLTHPVRDNRAGYWQTIDVLAFAKSYRPDVLTKTSLMLGLGETDDEIMQTMDDLRQANVDILTLGQYLQPTKNHLNVARYVTPEAFVHFREIGLQKGFFEVASGPLVRSSYRADRVFKRDNLGLISSSAPLVLSENEPEVPYTINATAKSELKVLLVEDNKPAMTVLNLMLQKFKVGITAAFDAESAFEIVQEQSFDLMITDIGLPGKQGDELVKMIRALEQQEERKPMKIVALTGHSWGEMSKACIEAGMNDLYQKPMSRDALQKLLTPLIKAKQ
jgi:lipoic acid synthetase